MRKHFLLLFLMAILPLAGWADPAALPSNLAVTFTALTYNGTDQTAAVAIATAKSGTTDLDKTHFAVDGVYADLACTNAATVKNAGLYYVKVTGDGTNYKNDANSYKVFTLSVAKYGDIRISAKALYKVYGAAYPTTGYYTATMPAGAPAADVDETAPSASVGLAVTASFSEWELNVAAGVHQFTIDANTVTNYNVVVENESANLTINKVNLTVKAVDKTITYGDAITDLFTVTYGSTLVSGDDADFGDVAYTVMSTTDPTKSYATLNGAVGTYTITPSIDGESANYNFNFETGTLTVNTKKIADDPTKFSFTLPTLVYNGADQVPAAGTIIVKDLTLNQNVTFDATFFTDAACVTAFAAGNHTNAGTYYAKISASGNFADPTTGAIVKPFTINQKPLAITTKNQEIEYTGAELVLDDDEITYEGLEDVDKNGTVPADGVFAEGVSIKVKTSKPITYVGEGDDYVIGAYAIKTVGETVTNITDVTKIFKNYRVAYFNDGVLTVTPKALTFTLLNQSFSEGTESNLEPGGSYTPTTDYADYLTVTGFAANDAVDTYPTLYVAATETSEGSRQYTITANIASMTFKKVVGEEVTSVAANNYKLAAASVTTSLLTKVMGNISVRPINNGAVYGAAQPELTVNVSTANATVKEQAAEVLKEAIVIAELADDGVTEYPNVGAYTMSLDLDKIADNETYLALKANYDFATFTGTYTITKRPLTKITIADQTIPQAGTVANLNKDLVAFEAADDYVLTDYDKATLKNEFEYVFKDGVNTNTLGSTAGGIRIAADAGFKNFSLPTGVTLGQAGNAVANKYVLGKLTVVAAVAEAIVLNPVKKATWLAADDGENTAAQIAAIREAYGYTAIKAAKDKVATVKFGNFTMVAERWYTMVLPFATTVSEVSQKLGYAVVNVLNKSNDTDDVKFKLWMQEIAANEPFLVKVYKNIDLGDIDMDGIDDGDNDVVTFTGKVINFTETPSVKDAGNNEFIGTFKGYIGTVGTTNEYYMATSNGGWYNAGMAGTDGLGGYTRPSGAYLKVATSGARIFIEEPDGTTTTIETINGETKVMAEGWYTINGMKLNAQPTEKGIYIHNGKKIVVK